MSETKPAPEAMPAGAPKRRLRMTLETRKGGLTVTTGDAVAEDRSDAEETRNHSRQD